jgi:hypothetical protein
LGDQVVYSQRNFLLFLMEKDSEGLEPIPQASMPADWPRLVFPAGSYNGMPFRGMQTGREVDFTVANVEPQNEPQGGFLADANPHGLDPAPIGHVPGKKKYTMVAESDPSLTVTSGPMGGSSRSKTQVAVVPLANSNDVMTFSLNVTLSKWSYRKITWGLGLVAVSGLTTTVIVNKRRKKFRFNKFNEKEKENSES